MQYTATLYINTGFNSTNVPDSPGLLSLSASSVLQCPALEIYQDRFLSRVRISVSGGWLAVRDADYLSLSSGASVSYYSIDSVLMVAGDVAELSVTEDFISGIGGIGNIKVLDGVTERVHVSDDSFGLWDFDDEMLIPGEELGIKWIWYSGNSQASEADPVFIESTVDPVGTMNSMAGAVYASSTNDISVAVPKLEPVDEPTKYKISGFDIEENIGTGIFESQGQVSSGSATKPFMAAISNLRSLGVEQSVISQFVIPRTFIESFNMDADNRRVQSLTGKNMLLSTTSSDLEYVNTSAKNNRVNYSKYQSFGIKTSSGEGMEATPSVLYIEGETSPKFRMIVDPRPSGKPYYRFASMNGDTPTGAGFFRNAVAGMSWKQVPLIFQGKSGSYIDQMKFSNSQKDASFDARRSELGTAKLEAERGANLLQSSLDSILKGNLGSAIAGPIKSEIGYQYQSGMSEISSNQYAHRRKSDLEDFAIAQSVSSPTVQFPADSEIIRDFLGNGLLIYRYKYSDNDVKRIDKLLTMYGYRVSKPLEPSDFTCRKNFNYVSCSSVTCTGFSRYVNEGLGAQLRSGVRVWHVKPDPSLYLQENAIS